MKKKVIIFTVALVVAVVGVLAFLNRPSTQVVANAVNTEIVRRDSITETITAKGEVSLTNSELIYSAIRAEVEEVFVEKNDIVSMGDPLLRYRERSREDIETKLRTAQLNLQSAQIALNNELIPPSQTQITSASIEVSRAEKSIIDLETERENILLNISRQEDSIANTKIDLENMQTLFDADAVSRSEVEAFERKLDSETDMLNTYQRQLDVNQRNIDMARETLNMAKINSSDIENRLNTEQSQNIVAQRRISVSQAQLEVDRLQKELADFSEVLYSPISGTITDLRISKGELAPTERPLMEISNIDEFVVKAYVNERHIARVQLGQEVLIEASVLGRGNFATGTVSKIGQIAERRQSSTGTEIIVEVEVTVNPSEEASLLKPGFSIDVTITTSVNTDVVVVSILSTLTDTDQSSYVFVVREDNTLEKRTVVVGAFADMYMQVTGIKEGEVIVSQPTLAMYDGMVITAVRD